MHRHTLRQLAIPAALLSLVGTAAAFRQAQPATALAVVSYPDTSDKEIVSFLIKANSDEISQAQAALPNAQDPDVKRFAQRMIKDHGEALTKERSIARTLGVTVSDTLGNPADTGMAMPRNPSDSAHGDTLNPNYHDSVPHRPDAAVPSNDSIRAPGDSMAHDSMGHNPADTTSLNPSDTSKAGMAHRDSTGMRAGAVNPDQVYIDAQVTAHEQVLEKIRDAKVKDKDLKKHLSEVKKTVQSHLKEAKRIQSNLERTS